MKIETKTYVYSMFHICWGAQAGLYYHDGIHKHDLQEKLFGVFPHMVARRSSMFMRGFDGHVHGAAFTAHHDPPRGSVGVRRTENSGILAKGRHLRALNRGRTADL